MVAAVQREVLPYDKNYLRRGDILATSLVALEDIWADLRESLRGVGEELVRTRQAAAMTAHARWMYHTALARAETRVMAKRLDFPDQDPAQQYRLTTGGLDRIWVRPDTRALPRPELLRDRVGVRRKVYRLVGHGLLGSYWERIGWGKGRTPGSRNAIGPSLRPDDVPIS